MNKLTQTRTLSSRRGDPVLSTLASRKFALPDERDCRSFDEPFLVAKEVKQLTGQGILQNQSVTFPFGGGYSLTKNDKHDVSPPVQLPRSLSLIVEGKVDDSTKNASAIAIA